MIIFRYHFFNLLAILLICITTVHDLNYCTLHFTFNTEHCVMVNNVSPSSKAICRSMLNIAHNVMYDNVSPLPRLYVIYMLNTAHNVMYDNVSPSTKAICHIYVEHCTQRYV